MKRIHPGPVTPPEAHHATHAAEPAKKHSHLKPQPEASALESAPLPAAAAPAAATSPPAPSPASPVTPAPLPTISFIALPPASANIPTVPSGWVPRPGEDYRGNQPKAAELTNLQGAISDLQRFTNFTQVFGSTVPPIDQIIHLLEAGLQWSTMRVATAEWDVYAQAQEGLSWIAIRLIIALLRGSFDLATQVNSNLATMYPSLASFLDAQKVIARKGASTRAANKEAVAKGEPPTHGKVGKARAKAAAKAALKAASEPPVNAPGGGSSPPPAQPAGAPAGPAAQGTAAPPGATGSATPH